MARRGSVPLHQSQKPSPYKQEAVRSMFSKSARPPAVVKGQAGRAQSRQAPTHTQAPSNDHQLIITSARIVSLKNEFRFAVTCFCVYLLCTLWCIQPLRISLLHSTDSSSSTHILEAQKGIKRRPIKICLWNIHTITRSDI